MSFNFIFHISDFHNLKIVENIFVFIFEGGLIFLYRYVYTYVMSSISFQTFLYKHLELS